MWPVEYYEIIVFFKKNMYIFDDLPIISHYIAIYSIEVPQYRKVVPG